jgi:hypothetical protein
LTRTALLIADRYELQDPVGRGGMAVVHRGWDRRLDRPVAIKVFRTEASGPAEAARRRSETQLLASLHHPSLVTLFDAVTTDEATFLVMELVEGPTLRQCLQHSPLPIDLAAAMTGMLAEGLHAIHERGIVHRDIKPANVLLAPSTIPGRPPMAKLSDFGIARLVESDRVTSTGTFVGTAQYLSPEQARGEQVGPPSDIYSLGLMLLEAMTGVTPFPGGPMESASARLARDPVVPGSLGYGWKSLLTAMTQRNPAARPTALEVVLRAQALQRGDVEDGPTEVDAPLPQPYTAPLSRRTTRSAPLPAAGPVAAPAAPDAAAAAPADPTRTLPVDDPFRFEEALRPAEATTVLPTTAGQGLRSRLATHPALTGLPARLEGYRAAGERLLVRALQHPATRAVLAWVRRYPALALGLAAVAAVLLAILLLVALMPGSPAPAAAPVLPATGQPLQGHLQRLLESVSR